jgi:DNA-directed RNA polymerase specialized sigma24 family protein
LEAEDPRDRLQALRELLDWLAVREREIVREARRAGLTWQEIAELLGRVRSSVWEKHASATAQTNPKK